MLTALFVCVGLAIKSHADTNSSSSSSQFIVENEFAKLSRSCFSSRDYELLSGDFIKHGSARLFSTSLLDLSSISIGQEELRKTLHFAPPTAWKPYNNTRPSEAELSSVANTNIEAYYDLVEPRSSIQSIDNIWFYEKNVAIAVAYLDRRLPSIRNIYRHWFEEILQGLIEDRKSIDRMIDEFLAIYGKIGKAISEMRSNDDKCWI
ncbi:unnamed protein product [Caenorhabditis angaria]|uniref:Uncharacterized protein n=1 Tax=Caenorhabditis angaria TaxID=860376 RepID=A0A9P1INW6_9PELO|nr:unnamed protein product [Caenorhabditis angaria]